MRVHKNVENAANLSLLGAGLLLTRLKSLQSTVEPGEAERKGIMNKADASTSSRNDHSNGQGMHREDADFTLKVQKA